MSSETVEFIKAMSPFVLSGAGAIGAWYWKFREKEDSDKERYRMLIDQRIDEVELELKELRKERDGLFQENASLKARVTTLEAEVQWLKSRG